MLQLCPNVLLPSLTEILCVCVCVYVFNIHQETEEYDLAVFK